MVNVITRIFSMEIGNSVESDNFDGDFMVRSVWVFMEKTWEIHLPDNLHINFTIKSP